MKSFSDADVARYLALAREIGAQRHLYDSHVHLTDVFDSEVPSLKTLAPAPKAADGLQPAGFRELSLREQQALPLATRNQVSRMMFEEAYKHAAPLALRKQMDVAGISGVLALPVPHPEGDLEGQMLYLSKYRDRLPEAMLGYTVPASESPDLSRLLSRIHRAQTLYDVKAIKLHSNISRINLSSTQGRRHAMSVIEVCGATGLPLIVHGGASPILSPDPCCDFGRLEQLAALDWDAARVVIIAHCGLYGCTRPEIENCLPVLKDVLGSNDNIFVDTSGLTSEVLEIVIRSVGIERMLFGSDALYHPVWKAVVAVLHAFHQAGLSETDALSRIASETPARVLNLPSTK